MLKELYFIIKQSDQEMIIELSSKNHPIFKAHFPSYPLLPGFALIDILAEILDDKIIYIKQSKFIEPLRPEDILLCQIEKNGKERTIKIYKKEKKVSEFTYESK